MRVSIHKLPHSRSSLARPPSTFDSQTSVNAKVSSMLSSCRICLSSIFDAAALTCGHKFCERCLDQYWRVTRKPDCIICPLCRACAFNVDFAKTDKPPSTDDFRRMFTPVIINETTTNRMSLWCLRLSMAIPAIYFIVKWLKPNLVQLLTCLYLKLTSKV